MKQIQLEYARRLKIEEKRLSLEMKKIEGLRIKTNREQKKVEALKRACGEMEEECSRIKEMNIIQMLSDLSEDERKIAERYYFEGMTWDYAVLPGYDSESTRKRIQRALKRTIYKSSAQYTK